MAMILGPCDGDGCRNVLWQDSETNEPKTCDGCLGVVPVVLQGDALDAHQAELAKQEELRAKQEAEDRKAFEKWQASRKKGA
jgi:hypothetical protein